MVFAQCLAHVLIIAQAVIELQSGFSEMLPMTFGLSTILVSMLGIPAMGKNQRY
jgi:hypothetical protein